LEYLKTFPEMYRKLKKKQNPCPVLSVLLFRIL